MLTSWDRLRGLEVVLERVELERLERVVATRAFRRVTTVVRMRGGGCEGVGEDVTMAAADHDAPPSREALDALRGRHDLEGLARALERCPLWPRAPAAEVSRRYRRWAFEAAALDLALRQAGTTLAAALGRAPRPVRFVASFRLGDPPSFEPVRARLERYPELRLKLDPTSDWTPELFDRLAATRAVEVVDLKGAYSGTMVDQPPDARLYARALAAFPDALVEDPAFTPATRPVLAPHVDRVAWDAPVLSAGELDRLPCRPAGVNVKPARMGTLAALLELYDRCEREGVPSYGGGLFELGPGRRQIQWLAALFHPDGPNDVAPPGYNEPLPPRGLEQSPLAVEAIGPAFGA